jgi:LmbE family N-acetylglucosaminyl deacetylase
MKEVAVIVAHPDDEVLACGATMRLHADAGDRVRVLILATGLAARERDAADPAALERLRAAARHANAELGCTEVEFGEFPDNRMDGVPLLDIVKRIESFVGRHRPALVYTHHAGDLNVDHRATAAAVLTACRFLPGAPVARLWAGEVLSSSEYADPADRFAPNAYVDIAAALDAKCRALGHYADEMRAFPHPRSIEAVRHLAALRGSEAGYVAAEAFRTVRERHDRI